MKLEIKHLAPYLPYGLKVEAGEYIYTMTLEDNYGIYIKAKAVLSTNYNDKLIFKPILHPLSDLTKEITVDGITFVPIYEIGNVFFKTLERFECDGVDVYGFEKKGQEDNQGYEFSYDAKGMIFGIWYDVKDGDEPPLHQVGGYEDLQKLFEWHFDVFSLIPAGLGIDINTLKP